MGIVIKRMVIEVISVIGCYHLVRMQVCEENWALGQALRNFAFKFQAEKDELEEVTKKEHLES